MKAKKNSSKNNKCGLIVSIVFSILALVSITFCGFYAYKYYSYPEREVIHCYLNNDTENINVYYTIQDGKVLRKEDVRIYPYSEELYNSLNEDFDDTKTSKYLGYMQKLTNYNNQIVKMELVDYERLSDEGFKDLFGVTDKNKYLTADEDFYTAGYNDIPGFTCEM